MGTLILHRSCSCTRSLSKTWNRTFVSSTVVNTLRRDPDKGHFKKHEGQTERLKRGPRRLFSKSGMMYALRRMEKVPINSNIELVYYSKPELYLMPSQFLMLPLVSAVVYILSISDEMNESVSFSSKNVNLVSMTNY